jgi:hypothetical protein
MRDSVAAIASSARRELMIVSGVLEPRLYDQQPFLDGVRRLATSGRRARIRILVAEVERAVGADHRLLELARRLSSFIEIRRLAPDDADTQDHFLLADCRRLLRQQTADARLAQFWPDAPLRGREAARWFDERWQRAVLDPNLRRLWL